MSSFKNIILAVFIAGAVIGVFIFGGIIKVGTSSTAPTEIKGTVTLWGTFSEQAMQPFFRFRILKKILRLIQTI